MESFFFNLYDAGNWADSVTVSSFLNDSAEIPNLTEDFQGAIFFQSGVQPGGTPYTIEGGDNLKC